MRFRSNRLDNEQLLDVATGVARVHAVPRGVGQNTADGPHDGYSGFCGSCHNVNTYSSSTLLM
jgi:hypothetical protein